MNRHVYNLSCIAGILACAVGAADLWGIGAGLLLGGALVLALTVYGVELARRVAQRSKA